MHRSREQFRIGGLLVGNLAALIIIALTAQVSADANKIEDTCRVSVPIRPEAKERIYHNCMKKRSRKKLVEEEKTTLIKLNESHRKAVKVAKKERTDRNKEAVKLYRERKKIVEAIRKNYEDQTTRASSKEERNSLNKDKKAEIKRINEDAKTTKDETIRNLDICYNAWWQGVDDEWKDNKVSIPKDYKEAQDRIKDLNRSATVKDYSVTVKERDVQFGQPNWNCVDY